MCSTLVASQSTHRRDERDFSESHTWHKSVTIRVPITLNSTVLHLLLKIPYYRLRVEADLELDEEGLPDQGSGDTDRGTPRQAGRTGVFSRDIFNKIEKAVYTSLWLASFKYYTQ